MNRLLLVVGLILIGTGAVIMSGYSVSWTDRKLEIPAVNSVTKKWSVSGELKKGDWLVVNFQENAEWIDTTKFPDWEIPDEVVPIPHFFVSVTIADPYGNETTFVEALGYYTTSASPYPRLVSFPPEITKNGSLQTILAAGQGGIEGVGGIVKYDGLHTVSMTAEYRGDYPPSYIGMFRYIVTEHHDIVFLLVGALVVGVGATSSYFGLRKKRPKVKAKET